MGEPFDFVDEGGWPYPDERDDGDERAPEAVDPGGEPDDELVALHALTPRALALLSADERAAVTARFGLDGAAPRTMADMCDRLGMSRERGRRALAGGLEKLRTALSDPEP